MTRVGVSGAAGRMGRLVAETALEHEDLELAGVFDPAGGSAIAGLDIGTTPEALQSAEVVVEFTRPDVVMANLALWRSMGLHAVVGTSGFDAARQAELRTLWGSGPPNCLVAPNFSIGAVVMMRLAELAAPHFPVAEVIELHHDQKADAPSGTALATAGRIAAVAPGQERSATSKELAPGALGANVDGVHVHAVRLPGLVAHQAVMFGGTGETLTIRHDTTNRNSFMPGVVLAIREVARLAEPVTIGLERLLGI
jgi:4-hydroxy-tetrahydrodipicolinate reductase